MNYESAVRYLLSLGRELAAPTQAAAAKFNLENITILLEHGFLDAVVHRKDMKSFISSAIDLLTS